MKLLRALLLALATLLFALPALGGPNDGLPKTAVLLDRATPRRAWDGFIQATRAGDYARAAHYLDLHGIPRSHQASDGPEIARKLAYVLERKLTIDPATLNDAPDGGAKDQVLIIGTLYSDEEPVPIALARVRFDDGVQRWLVARTTVAVVPELYKDFGPRGWEDRLPRFAVQTHLFGIELWQWIALFIAIAIAYVGGWLVGTLVIGILRRLAKRTSTAWDDELVMASRGPARLMTGVGILSFLDDPLRFTPPIEKIAHQVAFPALVVGVAWLVIGTVGVMTAWILSRIPSDEQHELESRGLRTQLAVMRRVTSIVVIVCAVSVILMQFEFVRSVGLSLLASAGLVGVVFGFAAQKSLAGVVAGIQLSITQPIRIGDSVVIENEFGTIEEINLTYVVVKVWDQRRLVVPISKFLETSFANWTKVSRALLGTVFFSVDFSTPVERVRAELEKIVKGDPKWDGRTCTLLVTEITDRAMQLRALVSAKDADDIWDLRCAVREKLMRFLAELEDGKYLVQVRNLDLETDDG